MEEKNSTIVYRMLEFTEYPGPRYISQGDDSGELFYQKVLKDLFLKTLEETKKTGSDRLLEINLDDTAGYASSFLDEAFGNLAYDFSEDVVKKHLRIVSKQEPDWVDIIFNETIPEWHKKKLKGIDRKPDLIS